jgi:PBP1b-binding outer membrane lipoprotein LpoB
MLRVYKILVAAFLLGGCYTQNKAVKQVDKALAHYPQIVAKIALDSFPCDVIRIDTIISVRDSIIECLPIETILSQIDTIYGTKKVFIKYIFY